MNEIAASLLPALVQNTILLAAAALLVRGLLAVTRCSSPTVHRLAWCLVLLQGWLFVRLPVTISYSRPQRAQPVAGAPSLLEVDHELLPSGAFGVESPAAPSQAGPVQSTEVTTFSWRWPAAVVGVWLSGMGVLVVCSLVSYLRFARRLPPGQPAEKDWVRQWDNLLAERGIRRAIPLRVTSRTGPLLCRLPGGYRLLVPARLWQSLAPAQRLSMLRHELAHYQRGDHWKSLGVRLLALPHWFNPLAWWAVRKFDECAEWACDQEATRPGAQSASSYARALLQLGEVGRRSPCHSLAAQGRGLSVRVSRLLTSRSLEDSIMKKAVVISLALGLIVFGALRVELVAEDSAADRGPIAALRPLGAKLDRDQQGRIVAVSLRETDTTDAMLVHLETFEDLKALDLAYTKVTDRGLEHLKGLSSLESLDLAGTEVTDTGLMRLKDLPKLRSLNLSVTRVTDAGLAHLRQLTSLKALFLDSTGVPVSKVCLGPAMGAVTNAGLAHLQGLANLEELDISNSKVTDAGIALLEGLAKLRDLGLNETLITDAGLPPLKRMAKLEVLRLRGTRVTDAGVVHVKELANLQWLFIEQTGITDAGLVHLKGLKNLTLLYLPRHVTDDGLAHVSGLTKLERLDVNNAQITNAGLAHLKGLVNLRTLFLMSTEISDAGIANLKELVALRTLRLDGTKITDTGLVDLKGLPNLEFLGLNNTQVTDAGLKHLGTLTKLHQLHVEETQVTDDGVKSLQRALPGLKIILGNPLRKSSDLLIGLDASTDSSSNTHLLPESPADEPGGLSASAP